MTGEEPSLEGLSESSNEKKVNAAVEAVNLEFYKQIDSPPNNNIHTAAFALAYIDGIRKPTEAERTTEEIVRSGLVDRLICKKNLRPPPAVAGLIRLSYYNQMMHEFPHLKDRYPWKLQITANDFEAKVQLAKFWREVIREVNTSEGISTMGGRQAIGRDLAINYVMTNKVERYKSVKLVASLYGERWDHPLRILDIGASRNHGLKALASGLHLGTSNFVQQPYGLDEIKNNLSRKKINERYNSLLRNQLILGESLGVDVFPLRGIENQWWAKSCSLQAGERNKKTEARYDYIEATNPINVRFEDKNLLTTDLGEEHYGQYDMVCYITMLHQLSLSDGVKLREENKKYLNPHTGIELIQDFAKANTLIKGGIEYADSWAEGTMPYHTILNDPFDRSEEPREFINWTGSRCTQGVVYEEFDSL
jgi:hypothetical protein